MIAFPEFPRILRLDHTRNFRYLKRYVYEWTEKDGSRWRIIIEVGFVCDLTSKPRIVWSVSSPYDVDKSAGHHDLLYRTGGNPGPRYVQKYDPKMGLWLGSDRTFTRKEADKLFRRMMKEDPHGPGGLRRSACYRAVRWFGGGAWQG